MDINGKRSGQGAPGIDETVDGVGFPRIAERITRLRQDLTLSCIRSGFDSVLLHTLRNLTISHFEILKDF